MKYDLRKDLLKLQRQIAKMPLYFSEMVLAYTCNCFAANFDEFGLDICSFLSSNKVIDNKVYIEPEEIHISSDQILVNVEGCLLSVENLSIDNCGVFTTVEELLNAAGKRDETWRCRWCGTSNMMDDRWCRKCGRYWRE